MVRVASLLVLVAAAYGVQFGPIAKFSRYSPSTAYHIEVDLSNPERLLISTFGSLTTVARDEEPRLHGVIGGDQAGYYEGVRGIAKFNLITSFRQINSTHIFVVDNRNHCIRYVNRVSETSERFAGKCTEPGFTDGSLFDARFNHPYNLINGYYQSEYYVTDVNNNAVRLINENSQKVTTLARDETLREPTGIAMDAQRKSLYVTVKFGIMSVNISTGQIKQLSSSLKGASDGPLESAKFGIVYKIIPMTADTYIIGDWTNKVVRVLDISQNQVRRLACHNGTNYHNTSSPCELNGQYGPYSLCFSDTQDKLYIGERNYVKFTSSIVHVSAESPAALSTKSKTMRPTRAKITTAPSIPTTAGVEAATAIISHTPDTLDIAKTGKSVQATSSDGAFGLDWVIYLVVALIALVTILIVIVVVFVMKVQRDKKGSGEGQLIYRPPLPLAPPPRSSTGTQQFYETQLERLIYEIPNGQQPVQAQDLQGLVKIQGTVTGGSNKAYDAESSANLAKTEEHIYEPVGSPRISLVNEMCAAKAVSSFPSRVSPAEMLIPSEQNSDNLKT